MGQWSRVLPMLTSPLASDSQTIQLQKKSENLRSQIARGKTEDVSALQNQLSAVEGRLQRLETEGKVAQTIIESYEPSVCLIHVIVGFRDHTTGYRLSRNLSKAEELAQFREVTLELGSCASVSSLLL